MSLSAMKEAVLSIDNTTQLIPQVLIDIIWQYGDYTPITIIVNNYFKQFLPPSLIKALYLPQVIEDANWYIEIAIQYIVNDKDLEQVWITDRTTFKKSLIAALNLNYNDGSINFGLLIPVIRDMIDLASDIHYTEEYQNTYQGDDLFFEALISFAAGLPLILPRKFLDKSYP